MAATQRPVTEAALTEGLPTDAPAWKQLPSWFVFGDQDLNIPVALQRFMADRAGAKGTREIAGASHAISVSAARRRRRDDPRRRRRPLTRRLGDRSVIGSRLVAKPSGPRTPFASAVS